MPASTRLALKGFAEDVRWAPLQSQRDIADPLSDDSIADMLLRSGNAALGELLAQRAARAGDAP